MLLSLLLDAFLLLYMHSSVSRSFTQDFFSYNLQTKDRKKEIAFDGLQRTNDA